ncbi:MAG: M20/M25/M40 family metallo-hydrolase, partial [Clostridia bacterium]|nr:M20/M25/M40 family metallo-hydrolase [Clostridia bacterium]
GKREPAPDEGAVERFRTILRQKTVWNRDPSKTDLTPFEGFAEVVKNTYPRVYAAAQVTTVNRYGLVFRFPGKQPALDPVILMAHYDVVPAREDEWTYPPFGAEIHDGVVYARGAVDTKCIMCAVFEAVDRLLAEGFTTERDLYFISSNNEEIGGDTTPEMVKMFCDKGISPYMVLDEGGAVTDSLPLGVKTPFAMVGVSEKGVADLKVKIKNAGGHSSAPSKNDSCAQLVTVLNRISAHPHKAYLTPEIRKMLVSLAGHTGFLYRFIFANLNIFAPLVKRIMRSAPETNAMISTTAALTMLNGSEQINVIPSEASAGMSVRISTRDTVESAIGHIKKVCRDTGAEFETEYSFEPSPVSNTDCEQFALIADTVKAAYPDADIAPYVMSGGTDSKHFAKVCSNVYRFAGLEFSAEERASVHGKDEGLRVESFLRGIDFYTELIKRI